MRHGDRAVAAGGKRKPSCGIEGGGVHAQPNGHAGDDFAVVSSRCFENKAPDHVVFGGRSAKVQLEFEITLLNWRNHFTCDLFAEKGSAHIQSLCKWGPSSFTLRTRVLPSGRPPEDIVTLTQGDPTWALEYAHFKQLCSEGVPADLSDDIWLLRTLGRLSAKAIEIASR